MKFKKAKYQPNCSEMCFKLTGTLNEIKSEVLNMLDEIEGDCKGYGKGYTHKEDIKQLRETVKAIKKISEFSMINIPFTTNYETFFAPDKNDNLKVATCNNISWDKVDYIPLDESEYDKIAKYNYYDLFKIEEYAVAKRAFQMKNDDIIVFKEFPSEADFEYGDTLKIIKKQGKIFVSNKKGGNFIEIIPVTDEAIINKLKILVAFEAKK